MVGLANHTVLVRRDGTEVPIDDSGSPIRDRDGIVTGVVLVFHDITDRKKNEKALRESEERLRTLADNISQLTWMADETGGSVWYNKRWYDYTGTTPEQMEGWGWQSVHDPDMLPIVLDQWKSSIASGRSFDMVFPIRGADGIHPFLTRVQPVKDDNGKIVRWFGTTPTSPKSWRPRGPSRMNALGSRPS